MSLGGYSSPVCICFALSQPSVQIQSFGAVPSSHSYKKGSHAVVLAFGPKLCLDAYKNSPLEFRLSFSSILIAIVTKVNTSTSTSTSTSSNDDDEEKDYDIDDDTASSSGRKGQARLALLVDGKWWLWTTYKSRPYLSLCPLMMISIPPSPAPDLFTTPTPFLPPVSSPGPLSLPFPITASSPSPSPAPELAPEPVQVPAVVKATRAVAGLSSAQSQQQHQKKKKTQKKKAGESKPPWRI
ncbi:hypothetical protein Trihar35433_11063 [Trichoderma harzianum]|nr:hypothetical protein Trihar35433_11063 [Trichoderma harzianum]